MIPAFDKSTGAGDGPRGGVDGEPQSGVDNGPQSGAGWVSRSHRAIAPFRLHRPAAVGDAVRLLAENQGARALAGGIDLIAALRDGMLAPPPADIVWLGGIAALRRIDCTDDVLRIGATATHHDIETSDIIARLRPDITAAWRTVGNIRVRMAGTVGGNLLAGNPAYEAPVILAALGARLSFATPAGPVECDLAQSAARSADWTPPQAALLTHIDIPLDGTRRLAFDRGLKPVISVALGVHEGPDGTTARAAVGCAHAREVGCAHAVALNLEIGPGGLTDDPAAIAGRFAAALPEPIGNAIAGADYRRRMAGVLLRRLIEATAAQSGANGQ